MDRIVLVTGANSGLGEATCSALEDDGDRVIRVDLAASDIDADLAKPEGRTDVVRKVRELAPGGIDAVITWAGGGGPTLDLLRVNYFGTVDLIEGLFPLLALSKSPRVVVTTSRMSLETSDRALVDLLLANQEATILLRYEDETSPQQYYVAAKTAVARWMRRTAVHPKWNAAGIRINAIAPGLIETPRTQKGLAAAGIGDWLRTIHPQADQTLSKAAEIGVLARFLASAENSLLIGQCIFADRGTEAILRGDTIW